MKFSPSAILGFLTGRHYASEPPTVAYGPIAEVFEGRPVYTRELPSMLKKHGDNVKAQLPADFKKTVDSWQHTQDFAQRVAMIDEAYGSIEISA